jgi:predicted nuclease of predicted toxin-antitoxin system
LRLLLDANLSPKRLGRMLAAAGHDVTALAAEKELEGLADARVLELATQDGRILVTANSRHFAVLARIWAEGGREHAGIVLVWSLSHRQFAALADGLEELFRAEPEQSAWRGRVATL